MSTELAILGADIATQQSGGPSLVDNALSFTAGSVVSGLGSIYNTVVDLGNVIGLQADKMDIGQTLEGMDRDWYNYYKENKQLVDVSGFIAGSLIPGTLGIKALKLAQAGNSAGAVGRAVSGTLNFAASRRDAYLSAGLKEIATEGGSVYSYINANKIASISWGFADQVLENAAFMAASTLMLNASPVLADSSLKDKMSDIGFGSLIGGGFGGAIGWVATNSVFKEAVKQVGGVQRKYDTFGRTVGLGTGDEAYGLVDALLALPKDVLDSDKILPLYNRVSKKTETLNLEANLVRALDKTKKEALAQAQLTLGKLGGVDDPEAGLALSGAILKLVKEGMEAGHAPEDIRQAVGNNILGLKRFTSLKNDAPLDIKDDASLFYISEKADLGKLAAEGNDIDSLLNMVRSRTPFEKNATAKPWRVVGDVSQAKMATGVTKFKDAWEQGADLAIIGGKFRINPKSEIFKQVIDPTLIPQRYFNTRTMGVSDEVVATWADMLGRGSEAASHIKKDGVLFGDEFIKLADDIAPADAFTATARHAWASKLDVAVLSSEEIAINDISRMERLLQAGGESAEGLIIKNVDGSAVTGDLRRAVTQEKLNRLIELQDSGVVDVRELAYHIAVPESWIERAIANGFELRTTVDDLVTDSWRPLNEFLKKENFIAAWESPRSLVNLKTVEGRATVEGAALTATEAAANSKGASYVDTFVTGDLGFRARVADSELRRNNAVAAVLGAEDNARLLEVNSPELMKQANELGVGAGFLSFSDASYGEKLKLWSQVTGKTTHLLIQKVANANLERIQPFIQRTLADKGAAAELGVITSMLRRSADKFVLVADDITGQQQLVVRELTIVDAAGIRTVNAAKLAEWKVANGGREGLFPIANKTTSDFLQEWKAINAERIEKRKVIFNSRGATLNWDPETIYVPPINTQRYPYFAFVKVKEGHLASNSDVGMITARSAEELNKLARAVPEHYEVHFKADTEQFFKIKGEYDAALSLNEPRVNSALQKQGKLGDTFYEVRPENVLEDYIQHSQAADSALVRHTVDTKYAQLTLELNSLGEQFTRVATSQASGIKKLYDKTAVNPFGDYVRTALDLSKRSSFPLVSQMNEFVDSAGTSAYRMITSNFKKAQEGTIGWQEAERIATKYGVGGAYDASNVETAFNVANRPADRNIIKEAVSKVNMTIAAVGLRLDFMNSFVNIISTPMMLGSELASIRSLAKSDPKLLGALNELTSINPNGTVAVPSTLKLVGQAVTNFFGDGGKELLKKYRANGDVKDITALFHEMMDDVAIRPQMAPAKWSEAVAAGVEKGSKITGNAFSEDFTRFVSANVMDQLTAPLVAAGKMTGAEANAYISVFVNRVNGNYIASQRPILFQGTVGSAVSLFQTYMFNVMQQMTRHIENRSTRALLTMGGLQGSLYGLNGLPFFDAVNTHLIGNAAINDSHRDVYSATTQLAGKELGHWLLYGTASAFPLFGGNAPSVYSRGDLNPRHVTVIPVSPLDIPAVDVSMKVAKNIFDIGAKISSGGSLGAALLEGLEHNGVSRPLAGLAQVAQGFATTGKGSLISSQNEFDAIVAATRMLGAKPVDEAIALDTMFRQNAYKAADVERLNGLGEAVKTKLRNNQMPDAEEINGFMKKYAASGGQIQQFSGALSRWQRDANTSVVEQMKRHWTSPYAQRLSEVMGGTSLPDFTTGQQSNVASPQLPAANP